MSQTANKAQADEGALSVEEFATKAAAKVALDIDDAPFLIEDEPKLPERVEEDAAPPPDAEAEEAAKAAALRRRKRLIIFGLAGLLLIVLAAAVWFFVLRPVPDSALAQPGATVVVVPSPASITGPPEFPVNFEDFWVPQKDKAGAVRFLRVHFSTQVKEEKFSKEIKDKTLTLRDAVYYYLRNKPHEFMIEPSNLPVIKQDVMDILNSYLAQGKVEDLFIENLLMK